MDLFKDKTESMPKESGGSPESFLFVGSSSNGAKPVSVATCMTPEQARAVRDANYPRWDWGDVKNLDRPKHGHHY